MNPSQIAVGYDPWVVLLSYVTASLASYVTLDLAKRVRTSDRIAARLWWIAGSLSMGTGIWAMHFIGMLALKLPFDVGYDYFITALSWLAAVLVSAIALHIAGRERLSMRRLAAGAASMGAGICAMHYIGMAALEMQPPIRWDPILVATSAVIAAAASGVALLIFFWLRDLAGLKARLWQLAAALVMGAAIAGMHYTGMAAAGFSEGTVCLSADELGGANLALLVAVASTSLLLLTMVSSVLDARRHATAEALRKIAFHDPLTGLPNRRLFDDRVLHSVRRSLRSNTRLAVLFVDLDGFKPINDTYGHALGDEVLREMARRLAAQGRSMDTVARIGGDEFVLLIEVDEDPAATARVAQRVIDTVTQPVVIGGRDLRLSCSIGIAVHPDDGPPDQLVAHADSAMYAAKRAGGSMYAFFEPHMNAGVREQVELQRDLRRALERGDELELHYQPKVSIDGAFVGAEALVRWRHPTRGLLGPCVFIPVAERFGLVMTLGNWVIDEACRQIAQWLEQGFCIRVAVNLSAYQLRQGDLVDRVEQVLKRHNVDPRLMTFEVTESVAMEDSEGTARAFQRLGHLGVQLSIDDFGTGYSSLSYLRKLHAGQLKIDRSFVQDVERSADARAIVEAVVRLAHALGLSVVAEGVETTSQREVLRALHCDELQGFLFARPMTAPVMGEWVVEAGRTRLSEPAVQGEAAAGTAARVS